MSGLVAGERAHLTVDIPTSAGVFARYLPVTIKSVEGIWTTVALIDPPHELTERIPTRCVAPGLAPYRRRCVYCERDLPFTRTTFACVLCMDLPARLARAAS